MKAKTYNQGATDERSAIRAKIKRLKKSFPSDPMVVLSDLEAWLSQRVERYNKKEGGLSSKRKAKSLATVMRSKAV